MSSKNFKDRKDAIRVKNVKGLEQILIDLKPNRCDSYVYIEQKIDMENLVNYINEKKESGINITYFHAFLAAIGKTFYNREKLNRFVANRHLYQRKNISISFVAKTSFNDQSEEIMVTVIIEPEDNIFTISKKVKEQVDAIRDKKSAKKGANSAIDIVGKLPNIIRIPIVGIIKIFDQHGILPNSLIKDNLYYSSIIVSNLGSIKCGAIHHNITNFGTCSSLATMGEIKKKEVIENDQKIVKHYCSFGINFDERVADGYYFSKSIKLLEYLFNNPKILEEEASKKINVEEVR